MTYSFADADASRDLVLERQVALAPEQMWAAWTQPELLVQWFTPAPWRTVKAELDVRPGGRFHTVMCSPEGEEFPGTGVILFAEKPRLLIWSSALEPGFRPVLPKSGPGEFAFTTVLQFEPRDGGTLYRATVLHASEESCRAHRDMGFHEGWAKALEQLVGLMTRG